MRYCILYFHVCHLLHIIKISQLDSENELHGLLVSEHWPQFYCKFVWCTNHYMGINFILCDSSFCSYAVLPFYYSELWCGNNVYTDVSMLVYFIKCARLAKIELIVCSGEISRDHNQYENLLSLHSENFWHWMKVLYCMPFWS